MTLATLLYVLISAWHEAGLRRHYEAVSRILQRHLEQQGCTVEIGRDSGGTSVWVTWPDEDWDEDEDEA